MIIRFPDKKLTPEVWNQLGSRYYRDWITYMINSKYRISKDLSSWINELTTPDLNIDYSNCKTQDDIMIRILQWTRNNIQYKSDKSVWQMDEYWQTPTETFNKKTGDCEDGAILIYREARRMGIDVNRLLLMCGDVNNNGMIVGHCWLAYRPDGCPLNFVFLDWCYFPDMNEINDRKFYEIDEKFIYRSSSITQELDKEYLKIWFCFNEEKSYSELKWQQL